MKCLFLWNIYTFSFYSIFFPLSFWDSRFSKGFCLYFQLKFDNIHCKQFLTQGFSWVVPKVVTQRTASDLFSHATNILIGNVVLLLFNTLGFTLQKQQSILTFTFRMWRLKQLPNFCLVGTKSPSINHVTVFALSFEQPGREGGVSAYVMGVGIRSS